MNEHAKLIEGILLEEIESHGFELRTLQLEKCEGYAAIADRIVSKLEAKQNAISWLRSLPDQQVVRVPKCPDTPDTDYGVGYCHGYSQYRYEVDELNPGAKIVEV